MVQIRQPTLQEEYEHAKRVSSEAWSKSPRLGLTGVSRMQSRAIERERQDADARKDELWRKLQAENQAKWAADPKNPEVQAQKAWDDAQKILQREGPLTPQVQQQIVNRRADQSAAAEAVNADEIRSLAAARGLDPTQALRQAQQQRQASNLAFQGDTATNAALQNFQATNANMAMAAQAMLNRQFGGQRQGAVQGAVQGVPQLAFSSPRPAAQSSSFDPGAIHRAAAQQRFNQPQLAFSGNTPAPSPTPQPQPRPSVTPAPSAGSGSGYVTNLRTGQTITTQPKPVSQQGAFGAPIYRTQAQQDSLLKSLNAAGNIAVSGGGNQPVTFQMPKRQDGSYWANPFK